MLLESYLQDIWVTPSAAGSNAVDVHDAVTGRTVCRVSSQGLDLAGAFDHARRVGGTALRALTFHQRADLLDALATAVRARREELYALSIRAGATLNDARYDVDGGIRVLRDYAARARTELPDSPHLVEGPAERLARGEDFLGVHLVSPSPGLMLQVNAFNFPVWAPLEKLAQALLAGMPSVVKPATPTAYLTEHLVRIVTDAAVLPPGALQMVVGSVRPALDLLGEQDVLSFTGSAATAATLRTHPGMVARSVRFNAEADSVNAIVLAPDVTPGSPLFEAFVREVVTEMTVKAGQKCTAIRRVLVPREHEATALDAIAAELAGVAIGNPASEGVRMGPVVSLAQRDDVRQAVRKIAESGRFVHGDPEKVRPIDADPDRGAFLDTLLVSADPDAAAPHEVEPFGPAATVLAYRDTAHATNLLARGRGSLVASVVGDDLAWTTVFVRAAAPWHGRMHLLDSTNMVQTTGHGSPLPALKHGGPGRAGGGSEMAGTRGVVDLMQRTALQASPRVLDSLRSTPSSSPSDDA
ncbi:phenylacetic acid degradation bifunctional protein PaaZ [Streptomyces europaeiscabiei]|uniref:phenylacetic acid degradation bifunctional protein PaaZ n=1 Tax=Streptomyces europaeiscabiei TaxID=146819 RepID=UPI0029BC96CC|nr:phenylacetic acid degradation bifunctional protein PaaZ [Streptomyces europaeiscabiei]MDX3588517.1 phenylacetic acid degradation bifunctional protein PaaZ [Streptomyces europaeiscabiei]MDX3612141.1 phenylacetic acid degradation bifunctional protein PaaZ [Streptomyces europaeiscabiei]MDX3630372.1 phenylacetic acid degradation bifunctional protein PaaZ [Streptomyces europaeiscabiei]MDX3648509.1 phenylacetic acid degradation bifunctional protein PaaZ [Streptomyces europaeiscabiei]